MGFHKLSDVILHLVVAGLLGVALGVATTAQAIQPSFGTMVGVGQHEMDRINGGILLEDGITGGTQLGVELGCFLNDATFIAAGYDHYWASWGGPFANTLGGIRMDVPANVLRATVEFHPQLPWVRDTDGRRRWSVGVGASGGALWLDGDLGYAYPYTRQSGNLDGAAALLEGYLVANFWWGGRVAVSPMVGFRQAKVENVQFNGAPLQTWRGADANVDYSGLFLRLGVRMTR